MADLDKQRILQAFIDQLATELSRAHKRAREAAEGVTHEENRAESDKDMRSTEASYIARGHSGRASELEQALARLSTLELLSFGPTARIAMSALVELEHAGKRAHYLLLPACGGERVRVEGLEVQALTTQSPLGAALLGLTEGDEAELRGRRPGEPSRVYEVLRVR